MALAITPDGKTAYVANYGAGNVSVIDTATNKVLGAPITVKSGPEAVAIVPDQSPKASLKVEGRARPGVPFTLDGAGSSDPDGTVASWTWAFGDAGTTSTTTPTVEHTYSKPGMFPVALTVTDSEGCSVVMIFTGQTALCHGSAAASTAMTIKVAYPGVRARCPKSAKPQGCRFRLQAVTKKRKGRAESVLAWARARAGHSALVSLKPRKAYGVRLATSKKVLVKETVMASGSKRTFFKKLKIVQ
jgi:YVTN family beta-propeller protein